MFMYWIFFLIIIIMPNTTLEELIKNTIIKGDASLENEIDLLFEYNI